MKDQVLRVCWLKDDKPGHLTKIKGLIKALRAVQEISVMECSVRWRPRFIRSVMALIPILKKKYPLRFCLGSAPLREKFDLIISAGGATEWPNAELSTLVGAKNIFFGSLRMCEKSDFSLLPRIEESHDQWFMEMQILPSELNYSMAAFEARQVFPENLGLIWTVLIGGNGSGIFWNTDDWIDLAEGMIQSARNAGAKLILTTSRRTGLAGEALLKAKFQASGLLLCAVWYSGNQSQNPPSLAAMIGQSELVFVTEDSASMVNEAVASGRPVITLKPEHNQLDDLIESMLSRLERNSYIYRNRQLRNPDFTVTTKEWTLMEDDWHYSFGLNILSSLDLAKE